MGDKRNKVNLRRNKDVRVGDRVKLLREINRVKEWALGEKEWHRVPVYEVYASPPFEGEVVEIFTSSTGYYDPRENVKVLHNDGKVYTFRMTSVARVD